jgi:hypothetical protein
VVLVREQLVGTSTTGRARPDVARSLKSDSALLSGFQFVIDRLPPGTTICDVRIAAEQRNGTIALLRTPACKANE